MAVFGYKEPALDLMWCVSERLCVPVQFEVVWTSDSIAADTRVCIGTHDCWMRCAVDWTPDLDGGANPKASKNSIESGTGSIGGWAVAEPWKTALVNEARGASQLKAE